MLATDIAPKDRLIVALDVPSVDDARAMVASIGDAASFYKVGLELVLSAGGLSLVGELADMGHRVFLDIKLLDIANTVERSVAAAARSGATFITVHATDRQTLQAAAVGSAGSDLRVLGVTVLTNLERVDLIEQGISETPGDLVARRAHLIGESGLAGIVAAGGEAARVRSIVGPDKLIVTPGIRRAIDAPGDQARVTTPADAIKSGADYLVVGRPITQSPDPRQSTLEFVSEIEAAANKLS